MIAIYNLNEIVDFIEKHFNIKVYEYQKKMLKCIIEGKKFSCPVHTGRKTMLNGYIEYLKTIHGKHLTYKEADEHITVEDAFKESDYYKSILNNINDDQSEFKREYECIWISENESPIKPSF